MSRLVSPNDLQKAAQEAYLEGREPKTEQEWALCVNFWATNIEASVRVQATVLMAKIMGCPLPDSYVQEIAEFQHKMSAKPEVK